MMSMQFGIMMRGQFPPEENVAERLTEMMQQARMLERLGSVVENEYKTPIIL